MQRRAFTLTESLIIGALFGLTILVGTFLLGNERARTRDAERIADMAKLASGFALLYAQDASYAAAGAGCSQVGAPAQNCTLTTQLGDVSAIHDPSRFQYTITRVPDRDDFGLSFQLERGYGQLRAGRHILTKAGIQ